MKKLVLSLLLCAATISAQTIDISLTNAQEEYWVNSKEFTIKMNPTVAPKSYPKWILEGYSPMFTLVKEEFLQATPDSSGSAGTQLWTFRVNQQTKRSWAPDTYVIWFIRAHEFTTESKAVNIHLRTFLD